MAILLTELEDLLLAMADDEYVGLGVARPVFGTYYERAVHWRTVANAAHRLAALGLVRWRIGSTQGYHYRRRASDAQFLVRIAYFMATDTGRAYLLQPRRVR